MSEEINKLHDLITNVRLDIARLDTKMDGIKDLSKKVEEVHDTALEAHQSTRAAHKRLDDFSESNTKMFEKYDRIIFWGATTIIGALIVGGITMLFKYKGGA